MSETKLEDKNGGIAKIFARLAKFDIAKISLCLRNFRYV